MKKRRINPVTISIDYYLREAFHIVLKEKKEYTSVVEWFESNLAEIIQEIEEKSLELPKQRWSEYFSKIKEIEN